MSAPVPVPTPPDLFATPATAQTVGISSRLTRLLGVAAALVLVVGWLAAEWIMRDTFAPRKRPLAIVTVAAALLVATAFAVAARSLTLRRLVAGCSATVLAVVFSVFVLEGAMRAVGIDFARYDERMKAVPTYFRSPRVPVGEVFFRREGPDVWNGQVLFPAMRMEGVIDDAYRDEKPVTITYDKLGFRNPDDLDDWDVVVVGDSFTELGYLPYDDLFTTRAARLTGKRIKNLGVCHTGPLTHNCYLDEFGKSPSTRHAVLAYFEGNDWIDIVEEHQRVEEYRRTNEGPSRANVAQTSLLKVLYDRATRETRIAHNAWFDSRSGSIPVTVKYNPYSEKDLTPLTRRLLEEALADWSRIARTHEMQPSLLYIPCKHRVIRRHIRFTENAKPYLIEWRPSDMPQYIGRLCRENGIRFIDAIPKLTQCADEGRLPYNDIWDTHLNREGSHIVGDVLAEAFRTAEQQQRHSTNH